MWNLTQAKYTCKLYATMNYAKVDHSRCLPEVTWPLSLDADLKAAKWQQLDSLFCCRGYLSGPQKQ